MALLPLGDITDLVRSLSQQFRDLLQLLRVAGAPADRTPHIPDGIPDATDRGCAFRARTRPPLRFPSTVVVSGPFLVLFEEIHAGLAQRIDLLALFCGRGHKILILQGLKRRIDGARAGAVKAAGAFFHLPDDVVTVARLLLQQTKNRELDAASLKGTCSWSTGRHMHVMRASVRTAGPGRTKIRAGNPSRCAGGFASPAHR